jgi:hypothetical protein
VTPSAIYLVALVQDREDPKPRLSAFRPGSRQTRPAAYASARGKAEESEILEVSADSLRRALAELPGVSEPIVRAFIMRRQRLKRDREFVGLRILAQGAHRTAANSTIFSTKTTFRTD